MEQVIQTEKLTKSYGKARGIIELDLSVQKGEIFGFIGPNGAGKSTTIRTLLGLIHKTSGDARLFGCDITEHPEKLRSRIGYMPSEMAFYRGMKVADILTLSTGLRGNGLNKDVLELCERLNLDTKRRVEELSLGNRKKVGIVTSFWHHPELYILDEPTSGLDPLMQKVFFELVEERSREGATIFLSSHVLSEVQRYCDRAAIIKEGRLITCDSVENLTKTSAKRITLQGDSAELAEQITKKLQENVKNLQTVNTDTVNFLYSGKPNQLFLTLAELPVRDVAISEPDLEEIFLHYYGKEQK